jgi:hypothetical protein
MEQILNNTEWNQIYLMYNEVDCWGDRYMSLINGLKATYGALTDGGNAATALRAKTIANALKTIPNASAINANANNATGNGNAETTTTSTHNPVNSTATTATTGTLNEITRAKWNVSDLVFDALHDVSMMAAHNKLIISESTFGFWGGLLSNAVEVSKFIYFENII